MRLVELAPNDTPRQWGRVHGEAFRGPIAELVAIRTELTVQIGGFRDASVVLGLAEEHLPVLAGWDADLYEELLGIAEGAALSPAELVVLNHYTDLRDIDLGDKRASDGTDEGCSVVYARTKDTALLGQTWDMHGTAEPYVMMIKVPEHDGRPAAWLFSIVGCLGMTGLNDAGVAIAINNLKSLDARIGILWPALVRRAIRERSVDAARDVVLNAPLGSGHHYLVASPSGAYGIEASGTKEAVVYDGVAGAYVHTNHCLDEDLASVHEVRSTSTTHERYEILTAGVSEQPIVDRADLWARLGDHGAYPRGVCTHLATPAQPHAVRTCGGVAIDLGAKDLWAGAGCLHRYSPQRLGF